MEFNEKEEVSALRKEGIRAMERKEMKFKRQWVDPAEGWKYGFPKIYDSDTDGTMKEWLLKNGYPESMIEFPIRYWLAVAEDEESVVKIQLDKQDNV
jgi:hypothetical protein